MSTENLAYKHLDHLTRDKDHYAQAKYDITRRWLKSVVRPGLNLFNIGCGGGEFNSTAVDMGYHVAAYEPESGAYSLALELRYLSRGYF
jgi:2-polyprenyl-3-methyl-5-hydroxy-6-metoxy-1,4-benzoquinol methylase